MDTPSIFWATYTPSIFWASYGFFSLLVGMSAESKGRGSFTWFIISLFITPILAGFFVKFMSNGRSKQ